MNSFKFLLFTFTCMLQLAHGQYFNPFIEAFDANLIKPLRVLKERISLRGKHSYKLNGQYYPVERFRDDFHQQGLASWYVGSNDDSRTAINEPYDVHALTAAHRTLPLPCYAKVTNLENGRSITVRINDRGPFVDNRIIDLSYAAAHQLGMIHKGLARVQIDTLNHDDDIQIPQTALQYGPVNASLLTRLKAHFKPSVVTIKKMADKTFLHLGPFTSQAKLERTRAYLNTLKTPHAKLTTLRAKKI